ncbi:MAG TPA: hypothetical protein VGF84_15915, partial [Micromonosporaceae bacterium]
MAQLAEHGTIAIPEATTTQSATSLADCDAAIVDLSDNAKSWFDESPVDLVGVLERLNDAVMTYAQEWVAAACAAKQLAVDEPAAGEEWANITVTARYVRMLA